MYNHPNIVEVLGISVIDDNQLFVIMPFANNDNLRNYIKTGTLSFNIKIKVMKDIASGIAFLHKNDIVHENLVSKLWLGYVHEYPFSFN